MIKVLREEFWRQDAISRDIIKPKSMAEPIWKVRPRNEFVFLTGKGDLQDEQNGFCAKKEKILCFLKIKNIVPIGPFFCISYRDRTQVAQAQLVWDVCAPVAQKIEDEEGFHYREMPEMEVLTVVFMDSYELRMNSAIRYLKDFARLNGIILQFPLFEVYDWNERKGIFITELQMAKFSSI